MPVTLTLRVQLSFTTSILTITLLHYTTDTIHNLMINYFWLCCLVPKIRCRLDYQVEEKCLNLSCSQTKWRITKCHICNICNGCVSNFDFIWGIRDIEIICLLSCHRVLHEKDSMTGNKVVTNIKCTDKKCQKEKKCQITND